MNKLAELILYIADKSQGDPAFGATKLNKILFTIDFFAYGILEHSISGSIYIRLSHGPVPRDLPQARDFLLTNGRAIMKNLDYFGKKQKRLIPLDEPDMSEFSQDEKKFIDDVIDICKNWNATELSNWTHTLRPWLDAKEHDEIPYDTVFVLMDTPISLETLEWGERRLQELRASGYVRS